VCVCVRARAHVCVVTVRCVNIGVYQCGLWSIVAEVRGGGLRCWGLCVFVIKSLMLLMMGVCTRNMSS